MSRYADEFPVLGSGGYCVPFALVKAHAAQCQRNHMQTPERLRERGGLGWSELYAVLHDIKWGRRDEDACRKHILFHLAKGTFEPVPPEGNPTPITSNHAGAGNGHE